MVDMPLPPVELVRPGLWSVPVPIPNNPLRYVLVYVFETDRGPYLVDAGWNTDDAFAALQSGLIEAGTRVEDVQGVLVTHIHPDHYGLAGRIREASGAWIALHAEDAALIHDRYLQPMPLLDAVRTGLVRAGAPEEEIEALKTASMPVLPFVRAVEPDVLIADGDKPEVPGWDLVAVWTPGHTPGHLCFALPNNRLVLTGDHVLPRITPNISVHPQAPGDPLGDFLRSLDKVAQWDADLVLPAHEHRFVGLRQRVEELKAHHERRFEEIVASIQRGDDTTWDIARHMTWSRPWDRINGFMKRAALGEAMAHLHALEVRGVLRRDGEAPVRWSLVDERVAS